MQFHSIMHQSVVAPALLLTGWAGDSGANVPGSYLLSSPAGDSGAGLVTLRKYTPVEFTIIKSSNVTLSRSLQCRAFSF